MATLRDLSTGTYGAVSYNDLFSLKITNSQNVLIKVSHDSGYSAIYDVNLNLVLPISYGEVFYLDPGEYIVSVDYSTTTYGTVSAYIPSNTSFNSLTGLKSGSYSGSTYNNFYRLSTKQDGSLLLNARGDSASVAIYDKDLNFVKYANNSGPTELDAGDYMVQASYSGSKVRELSVNIPERLLVSKIPGVGDELDNILEGSAEASKLIGGKGDDTYIVDLIQKGTKLQLKYKVIEKAWEGTDTLKLRAENIDFQKAAEFKIPNNFENIDASLTGSLKLNLTGNASDNILIGNAADNILDGKAGIDTLIGGSGNDTYVLDREEELALVGEAADEGNDTLRIAYKNLSKTDALVVDMGVANLVNIENASLVGRGLFELIGNDLNNRLDAGKGAHLMRGGAGNDVYVVGNKNAQITELQGEGSDTVESSITWTLGDNLENLTLTGKSSINATANELDNQLLGNTGNNILDGGLGRDVMVGGKGNDTYVVDDENDQVIELANEGTDTVKASANWTLGDNLEKLILTGEGHLYGIGNYLKNILTGNNGNNVLDGGEGADKLIGGLGDDTYIVDLIAKRTGAKATVALEDAITEKKNSGNDTLQLRVSDDVKEALAATTKATTFTLASALENLDASQTDDIWLNLTGNGLDNFLVGNAADNIIIGGAGADTMTGGCGNDIFRFTSLKDLGLGEKQDVITDFTRGEDMLDFKALKGWSLVVANEVTAIKQLWTEQVGADLILYGNSAGDSAADFSIKLVGVSGLGVGDLIFT